MSDHVIDVDFEDDDIDDDVVSRTVKVTLDKKVMVYRPTIFKMICLALDSSKAVEAISKRDKSEEWYVTLKSSKMVEALIDIGSGTYNGIRYYFCDATKSVVNLRVHWVPRYVKDRFLRKIFERFGEVTRVYEERSSYEGVQLGTGMRAITLVVSDFLKTPIPHMIRVEKSNLRMLVTAPGRLPLCLKCNCIGHVAEAVSPPRPSAISAEQVPAVEVLKEGEKDGSEDEREIDQNSEDGDKQVDGMEGCRTATLNCLESVYSVMLFSVVCCDVCTEYGFIHTPVTVAFTHHCSCVLTGKNVITVSLYVFVYLVFIMGFCQLNIFICILLNYLIIVSISIIAVISPSTIKCQFQL
ncbi:uncharacterized protein LOC126821184 [Patella vulgata]|uniref:uncharacterized protein LOC126821184 n=1 Tax=Patella vulgata TaxID=6465 RepID=UPI00218030E6|nr:uncharacterized protein LOC126821184 [Patella vulgata]